MCGGAIVLLFPILIFHSFTFIFSFYSFSCYECGEPRARGMDNCICCCDVLDTYLINDLICDVYYC